MLLKPRYPQLQRGDPLARGVVGAWPFHEGSGNTVRDLSGNGYNGVCTTGVWASSPVGSALTVAGIDGNTAQIPSFGISTGKVTIAAWVLIASTTGGYYEIFRVESGTSWYLLYNHTSGGTITFSPANDNFNVAGISVAIGEWNFIVATFDGATVYLYKNAALATSMAGGALATDAGPAAFGADPSGGQYLDGKIGGALIYNRALSAAEVAQLYQDPFRLYRPRSEWWRNAVSAPAASSIVHRRTLGQRTGSRAA
jgi:large repetitive protein